MDHHLAVAKGSSETTRDLLDRALPATPKSVNVSAAMALKKANFNLMLIKARRSRFHTLGGGDINNGGDGDNDGKDNNGGK